MRWATSSARRSFVTRGVEEAAMNGKDFRPGANTLIDHGTAAPSSALAPGRRTLTEALPAIDGKAEPKDGGTAKIDGGSPGGSGGDADATKTPAPKPTAIKAAGGAAADAAKTPAAPAAGAGAGA